MLFIRSKITEFHTGVRKRIYNCNVYTTLSKKTSFVNDSTHIGVLGIFSGGMKINYNYNNGANSVTSY